MSLPEYAAHLNDNVQAQSKKYKYDSHESHFMSQCFVPSQAQTKLNGAVLKKAGSSYGTHTRPALYQPWVQQESLIKPPVPFQAQVKALTSLQKSEFPPTAMQSPPVAKLLTSVQQMLPAQLPSQLLQHQRPLVQLLAQRMQAMKQQTLPNYPQSLHDQIKDSNSNFLLRPRVKRERESEGDNISASEKVSNLFCPSKKAKNKVRDLHGFKIILILQRTFHLHNELNVLILIS